MKRYFVPIFALLFGLSSLNSFAAQFSTKGGSGILYKNFNAPQNGDVFIFSGSMDEVELTFSDSTKNATSFNWFEYESNPADTVKLTENITVFNDSTTLKNIKSDHGYLVKYEYTDTVCTINEIGEEICEEATLSAQRYVWIAQYKPMETVTWNNDSVVCDKLSLYIEPAMKYTLGNAKEESIERDLTIEYFTFKKEENNPPSIQKVSEKPQIAGMEAILTVPYVDTDFTITDDWGKKLGSDAAVFVTDSTYKTFAVVAFPAMTVNDKQPNELDKDDSWDRDEFGNVRVYFSEELAEAEANISQFRTSAPLSVDFVSNPSDKVTRYEWHIARNPDFSGDVVFFQEDLNGFEFKEDSTHYIKLVVFNTNGTDTCEYTAYACLNVSESAIYIPNTFTPDGDGINDEFRVAYRSIASYRCRIYNQWGRMVYDSDDITRGWDGTIGGRPASIGVYFYVIDAVGTNGKKIKTQDNKDTKGDINLVRSK